MNYIKSDFLATIQKNSYFPKYSAWVFAFLLLIFSIVYNYQDILFKSPQSIHLWRQCDCLSITLNYYQENNPFFEPSIHNLGSDGTGKTVSDFPLIYYSVAQLWKVFGYHEYIFRFIVLLFFFSGLLALFKIFENVLKDSVLAIAGSLFLFTSPTLVYYANNFLMDIPAFSLAMIGLYFFFRFTRSSLNRHFYLFAFFYSVAGLLKISSLLSFIAITGVFILELFNVKFNADRKIFQNPLKQSFVLIGVVIIQIVWYMYAVHYDTKHNAGIFLIGTLPIWDLSNFQIKETLDAINEHLKWDYFRKETHFVFAFMFLSVLVFFKRIEKLVLILTVLISIGLLLFALLFFQALKDHDYYTVNLFVLVPFIILSFLLLLRQKFNAIYASILFRIILIAFLIHNVDFARRRMESRYGSKGWQNENYIENVQSFEKIRPYLRSIGINRDDKVISLSDNSINISLYFMNQKGWTNYGIEGDSEKITDKIKLGAKYLFIYNKEVYEDQYIMPFIRNKIGEFNNIDIYAL
jgi:hypothetical protein